MKLIGTKKTSHREVFRFFGHLSYGEIVEEKTRYTNRILLVVSIVLISHWKSPLDNIDYFKVDGKYVFEIKINKTIGRVEIKRPYHS